MSLSRADVETLIVARLSPLLAAAGMAITIVGSNADLNDPIGHAILDLGYTVVLLTSVADVDVAQIIAAEHTEFLDVTELHALENILGNLDDVDIKVGPRSEKLSQLSEKVERKIKRLLKAMALAYGYGMAIPQAGYITRDIAEHD